MSNPECISARPVPAVAAPGVAAASVPLARADGSPVYLDHAATTPILPEALAAMVDELAHTGNPSSLHNSGRRARRVVEESREVIAQAFGARPSEVIFTSGGTEADNLAIKGLYWASQTGAGRTGRRRVLATSIEHHAVLDCVQWLAEYQGACVEWLGVDDAGRLSPDVLRTAIERDPASVAVISVMWANNEVGTIQPIAEIAALAHRHGALMHTDAAQSAGKLALDVDALGVDLLTLAGHKFYAPKGIGALYVRTGTPITAVLAGAGQERGLRPGTENIPQIVALGAAARLARERLPETHARLRALRDRLHARLSQEIPGLALNGHLEQRLPNTLNVSFPGVSGALLLQRVADRVAAATGSACHAGDAAPSGVLEAMGLSFERALGAVRLSVGHYTREAEIDAAAAALIAAWRELTITEHG